MTRSNQEPSGASETAHGVLVLATSAAIASLLPVAAYQLGMMRHLPDPPHPVFASDEITCSSAAHPLGIPDGLLGLASYGTSFALVMLAPHHPIARKLLSKKLVVDGTAAGINVVRQAVSFRKLCSWCTGTALCTAVMLIAGQKYLAGIKSGDRQSL